MQRPVRKAILPVGGLGTRFLPATKVMPKEMLPVVDKPLIQYAVEEGRASGIEQFIFVTARGKNLIEDHFDLNWELQESLTNRGKKQELAQISNIIPTPGQIAFTRQPEPAGLGHAVWCARHLVGDEPFAVLLPDDLVLAQTPCLLQMLEAYERIGGNVVAVMDVPREHTRRYGVLDVISEDGRIAKAKGLIEKPEPEAAPSTLSIIGRYILQPEVLAELERQERGAGGEIQLTDAMARTVDRIPFYGFRFEGTRFDCGSKAGFIEANIAYAIQHDEVGGAVRAMLERYAALVRSSEQAPAG